MLLVLSGEHAAEAETCLQQALEVDHRQRAQPSLA